MKQLLLILAVVFAPMVKAQKPVIVVDKHAGWHKIGEVTASFQVEKDGITIMGADHFKSIKFKVTDARINIYDVEVYYESGDSEHLEVKSELKPGEETKPFALKQNMQGLKKVVFTYKSAASIDDDKAHIELYGLK